MSLTEANKIILGPPQASCKEGIYDKKQYHVGDWPHLFLREHPGTITIRNIKQNKNGDVIVRFYHHEPN